MQSDQLAYVLHESQVIMSLEINIITQQNSFEWWNIFSNNINVIFVYSVWTRSMRGSVSYQLCVWSCLQDFVLSRQMSTKIADLSQNIPEYMIQENFWWIAKLMLWHRIFLRDASFRSLTPNHQKQLLAIKLLRNIWLTPNLDQNFTLITKILSTNLNN